MKASNLARMSLARKPEQVYYVPPRCRYKSASTEKQTSLFDEPTKNISRIPHNDRPDPKPSFRDDSERISTNQKDSFRSLADRLETLAVKDPLRRSKSSFDGSTIIMTTRSSGSQSQRNKNKKLPTLQVYVPPHKRNQSANDVESALQQSTSSADMNSNEDSLFTEDINVDPFTNFKKSRRSDPYIYRQLLPVDYVNDDEVIEKLSHVIEVSNIDPSFEEKELLQELNLFSCSDNVDVRWVSDTSALLVFPNPSMAESLLCKHSSASFYIGMQSDLETNNCSTLKLFSLINASLPARRKAFAISEELKTKAETEVKTRPETTNLIARQFIGRHLGRNDILPVKSELKQGSVRGKSE